MGNITRCVFQSFSVQVGEAMASLNQNLLLLKACIAVLIKHSSRLRLKGQFFALEEVEEGNCQMFAILAIKRWLLSIPEYVESFFFSFYPSYCGSLK